MRRRIQTRGALILSLLFCTIAAAQGTGRLNGQVLDRDGKAYPDVTVVMKNSDTGQTLTVKTDKNGKFVQLGLRGGVYEITLTNQRDNLNYAIKYQVNDAEENSLVLNFKEILAKVTAEHPEEIKKREEEQAKFGNMKAHFDAGLAAINEALELKKQLRTAAADQRGPLQEKLKADYRTAINELQQAEQGVGPKDVANHALVWANLGQAYEYAGQFDEGANAFEKAVELKPEAPYYAHLATNLAYSAAGQTDPKAAEAKAADANAACEKAAALDPTSAASCWKNVGIAFSNKGRMKEAVAPLQKSTQVDPKDADAWFFLGGALIGSMEAKQQGDKIIYKIPPGTEEAFKKYLALAPKGPHAADAQANLATLATLEQGEETEVKRRKH